MTEGFDAEILRALHEDFEDALEERAGEFNDMQSLVWARIDEISEEDLGATPGWSPIVEALRADHAAALADLEIRRGEFADGSALLLAEDAEIEAQTLGSVLRDEVEAAVTAKDGAWSAFSNQVMAEVARIDGSPAEAAADEAIRSFKVEIDSELDAMAPRFDRDFREGVERRIFRSARATPDWWQSVKAAWSSMFQPIPSMGLAAATAAAVTLAIMVPSSDSETPASDVKVSISAVRFGASTVTVMPDNDNDGIALVWVTDDAS